MIQSDDLTARHMIPRWRSVRDSVKAGELSAVSKKQKEIYSASFLSERAMSLEAEFQKKKDEWIASGSLPDAEELLSIALIARKESDEAVFAPAQQLLYDQDTLPELRSFADRVIHGLEPGSKSALPMEEAKIRAEIARRKALLSLNPRDGLLLAETALLYVKLGQTHAAKRMLEIALALNPHDRYILRAAARFFVHIDQPDLAVNALRKSPRSRTDPWLMAALLASESTASEVTNSWRRARSILSNENFSDFDRSELASEIATLELSSGSRRKALSLFKKSAVAPTENSIAQIEWAGRHAAILDPETFLQDLSLSSEAKANSTFYKSQWQEALLACEAFEPFSVRPAIFGSFVATTMTKELDRGLSIAMDGLRANPLDATLLNNVSVIYAYQGDIMAAKKFADEAERNAKNKPGRSVVAKATRGLIDFRSGQIDIGIERYAEAIRSAVQDGNSTLAIRAFCYLGRELARLDRRAAEIILSEIIKYREALLRRGARISKDVEFIMDELENPTPREAHLFHPEYLENFGSKLPIMDQH